MSPQPKATFYGDSEETLNQDVELARGEYLAVSREFRDLMTSGMTAIPDADLKQNCSKILEHYYMALKRYTFALWRLHIFRVQ